LFAPEPVAQGHSSGAGDAFVAGLVARLSDGGSMKEAIEYGIGAARLILRRPETTTPELSPDSVEEEAKRCFYR
jgi:sugar/nucleoside kinase (ribokinase family)